MNKLPINIDSLLNGKAVENNRLEFKEGWNPKTIYRTICAFANDFDDAGGGYIIIGVEEKDGYAVRPVKGIDPDSIERIKREIIGYNNLVQPYYQPRLFVEEADGKSILIIKVLPGDRRPYKVADDVTAKNKTFNYYIRYNSSSIVAKNEYEHELLNMANRIPFDDRGNRDIQITDISSVLLRDYLVEVKSKLAEEDLGADLWSVLDRMDLLEGASEERQIKNIAAMMFCEHPEKFYKTTQVDIVIFPEGRENNPNNIIEIPPIKGNVPGMIQETLTYLRTNIIKKRIIKPKDNEKSKVFYNYPYQALEEAVVNALYHRDYMEREPVEITIEPDRISILSHSGPDRSISIASIKAGNTLRCRKYRNRRLGEFLKELDLTEGRATGIPTIQKELKNNGSPRAVIETDPGRTYFLIDIPCHKSFIGNVILGGESELESVSDFSNYQLDGNLTGQVKTLIINMNNQILSRKQVKLQVKLGSKSNLLENYLRPAMEQGYVSMLYPDKPRHPHQKYFLTDKGKQLYDILKSNSN